MGVDILARGLGANALRVARPRFRGLPRVAFMGDSNTAFGQDTTTTAGTTYWNALTYTRWIAWLARQRFYTDTTLNVGVGSIGTAHWVGTQVPQILAMPTLPHIVSSQIGINDAAGVTTATAAQMTANVLAGTRMLNAAGIAVVHLGVTPRSSLTTAQRTKLAEFNRQLYLMSRDPTLNVQFIDLNQTYVDFSTGNAIAGYQYTDNLHDAAPGGYVKAQAILATLNALLPPAGELLPMSGADLFDITLNPSGNMLANGMFSGTGGTLGNGATGSVASNFTGKLAAVSGLTSVAFSKGTDATLSTLPTQIMTISGTGDVAGFPSMEALSIGTPTGLVAGDAIYGQVELKVSNLVNCAALRLRITATGTGGNFEGFDGAQSIGPGGTSITFPPAYPASGTIVLQTPNVTIPAALSNLRWRLECIPLTQSSAFTGTVTLSRASLRKVL